MEALVSSRVARRVVGSVHRCGGRGWDAHREMGGSCELEGLCAQCRLALASPPPMNQGMNGRWHGRWGWHGGARLGRFAFLRIANRTRRTTTRPTGGRARLALPLVGQTDTHTGSLADAIAFFSDACFFVFF